MDKSRLVRNTFDGLLIELIVARGESRDQLESKTIQELRQILYTNILKQASPKAFQILAGIIIKTANERFLFTHRKKWQRKYQ